MSRLTTTEPPPTPVERQAYRYQWILRGVVLLIIVLWLVL